MPTVGSVGYDCRIILTASVNVFGSAAYLNSTTIGGVVVSSKGCLITYFAPHDDKAGVWTIVDISYPKRLFC